MFGDTSFRTKQASGNAIAITAAVAGLAIGSIWYAGGTMQYNSVIAHSSSPVGTSLKFNRSDAELSIKNIFTDKNENVLIAQLHADGQNSAKLPYKGTDYRVYISSKSTDGMKELPIIFGRMSTDGDLFLVLPKPTDQVYSVFIMNKKYLGSIKDENGGADSGPSELDDTKSISKALSKYTYDDVQDNGTYKIESDRSDVVSFRLTLNPASKDKAFKATKLDTNILISQGNKDKFNFEKFFEIVFKESALKDLENKYKKLERKSAQVSDTIAEYEERIAANPEDADAQSALENAQNEQASLDSEMESVSKSIGDYTALAYDDSMFADLNTKAIVVDTE